MMNVLSPRQRQRSLSGFVHVSVALGQGPGREPPLRAEVMAVLSSTATCRSRRSASLRSPANAT
jgi:hypothetical protein